MIAPMGMPSLKQKIQTCFQEDLNKESSVLYLLVEMGKYLERSNKEHLADQGEIRLNAKDYKTIILFRHWVAHTEITRTKNLPGDLKSILLSHKFQENNGAQLYKKLINEIEDFTEKLRIKIPKQWTGVFLYHLKNILAEQPLVINTDRGIITLTIDEENHAIQRFQTS